MGAFCHFQEVAAVSIVRIGLAETKKFAEGYSAIFGPKKKPENEAAPARQQSKAKKKDRRAAKTGKKKSKK